MQPSRKFKLTQTLIFATGLLLVLCLSPIALVSSSHRNGAQQPTSWSPHLTTASAAPAMRGGPNCNALLPSGGDDAININTCLNLQRSVTLTANTFLIYQPILA